MVTVIVCSKPQSSSHQLGRGTCWPEENVALDTSPDLSI